MDENLLPGQSGPAASRGSINPATGVQQYDVVEPAEALQEGLQEAWNFKLFPTKLLPFWLLFIVCYQYYVIFCLCDHVILILVIVH